MAGQNIKKIYNLIYFIFKLNLFMMSYLKTALLFFWEVMKVALLSLAIILPIRYFLVQPFYVKGASMEPTFLDHDYLLIDEISYRWREPHRGEVIVFRYPRDPKQYFIKRVIGLPGDRVVVRDGEVWLGENGSELKLYKESYLGEWVRTQGQTPSYLDAVLGEQQYYVMGDNRSASMDSRSFGPIIKREIIGRIWIRGWPFDRWTVFNTNSITI
jgi:signal peptidase I